MKKLTTLLLIITSIFLTSCTEKPKTAEEALNKTQDNIVEKINQSTLFSMNEGEFKSNLDVNLYVDAIKDNLNAKIEAEGKFSKEKDIKEANIKATVNREVSGEEGTSFSSENGDIKADATISLKQIQSRLYFLISELNIDTQNPAISLFTGMFQGLKGSWYYADAEQYTKTSQLEMIRNILKENKYKLFILNNDKESTDVYKNKVKLDKDAFANIIVDMYEETGTGIVREDLKKQVLQDLESSEILGELTIEKDLLHFEFNGSIVTGVYETPFIVKYQKNKFYIEEGDFIIDLDRSWSKFNGSIQLAENSKFNLEGKIKSNGITLNGNSEDELNKADFKLDFNFNSKKVEITTPEGAKDFEKTMQELEQNTIQDSMFNNIQGISSGSLSEEDLQKYMQGSGIVLPEDFSNEIGTGEIEDILRNSLEEINSGSLDLSGETEE